MARGEAAYLAQSIKNIVEIYQNLALGHFGNVVHGLTGIVPDTGILVGKAGKHRRYNNLEILGKLLCWGLVNGDLEDEMLDRAVLLTGPRAMAAAARPIKPPFRA